MFNKEELVLLRSLLTDMPKQIVILVHKNPDGDALGSAISLKFFLKNINPDHRVNIISPDQIPNFLKWLAQEHNILEHTNNPMVSTDLVMSADLVFLLDLNDLRRIGDVAEILDSVSAFRVLIDHHPNPEPIADLIFSFPERSSTAEIIWLLAKNLIPEAVDNNVAKFSFLGLVSDTGCFCFDSTTKDSFKVASDLLEYDFDKNLIINKIFHNYSVNRLKLIGYLLNKKLKVFPHKKTALITLSLQEMKQLNYQEGDHDQISNIPLSSADIYLSVFIMEKEDEIKISLRSKGDIDVNQIARKYFNGGGHKNAAGGHFRGQLQQAVEIFENQVLKDLKI